MIEWSAETVPWSAGRRRANPAVSWLATLALLCAGTARAEPPQPPAVTPAPDGPSLKLPLLIWTAGVAADQITTYRFSSQYGDLLHERNPLINGLDGHPALLVSAGSAIDAATGWACYRLLGRRHPRIARWAFYGAAAYRVYLAAYNLEMMSRARQVRVVNSANGPDVP